MIDKKSVLIGTIVGILFGVITSVIIAIIILNAIGDAFKVENMNITVAINQTAIEELIRESPGYQKASASEQTQLDYKKEWTGSPEDIAKIERIISQEYDRGFVAAMDSTKSNILFEGSTFEYDNRYFVKAQEISIGKVKIEVIQGGNYIFNGTCYKDSWCNIKDISFQIDDIHIGKEAAYIVYWSEK